MELVGYEDEEAGNSNCEVRSLRLLSWEVHTKEQAEGVIKLFDKTKVGNLDEAH